jgi:hypothetical protein
MRIATRNTPSNISFFAGKYDSKLAKHLDMKTASAKATSSLHNTSTLPKAPSTSADKASTPNVITSRDAGLMSNALLNKRKSSPSPLVSSKRLKTGAAVAPAAAPAAVAAAAGVVARPTPDFISSPAAPQQLLRRKLPPASRDDKTSLSPVPMEMDTPTRRSGKGLNKYLYWVVSASFYLVRYRYLCAGSNPKPQNNLSKISGFAYK